MQRLPKSLQKAPPEKKARILSLLKERNRREKKARVSASFSAFIDEFSTEPKPAAHHQLIINKLQQVQDGHIKRLMLFLPPGSAKSFYSTISFPPFYMQANPNKLVICSSHAGDLAERFGRKVRNIIAEPSYSDLLGVELKTDSKAAGRFETTNNAEMYAVGVGGSVTGRRGDLGLIDDPVKGRQDADSESVRDKLWEWYKSDFRTRLKPEAAIVIIQCMTGDTPVLMADGRSLELRRVRPGDSVATYDNGELSTAKVLNWRSNGNDSVYRIKMTSGIIVRCNGKHPFLVASNGEPVWKTTRSLRLGEEIYQVSGESGRAASASRKGAASLSNAGDTATPITIKSAGLMALDLLHRSLTLGQGLMQSSSTGMASQQMITTGCAMHKEDVAPYAENLLSLERIPQIIGSSGLRLTTATILERLGHFFATPATWLLEGQERQKSLKGRQNTSDFTTDRIAEIEECGVDEVFDLQVEGTENFIANGLVSHNTRWHEDDLSGRILPDDYDGRSGPVIARDGEVWEVVSLPMEAIENDALGRKPGALLWPDWFTPQWVEQEKRTQGPRNWNSLFQQNPTPDDGTLFKRDDIQWYERKPKHLKYYITGDYAVTENGGDYTEIKVWGVCPKDEVYLVDGFRGQVDSLEVVESLIDLVDDYKPMCAIAESGVIRRAIEPLIKKRMRERKVFTRLEWLPTTGDKVAMSRGFQAMTQLGVIHFPVKDWAESLVSQLIKFPAGRYDDGVDACGLLGRYMDKVWKAKKPSKSDKPPRLSGRQPIKGPTINELMQDFDDE